MSALLVETAESFAFGQLSDKAKDRAREKARNWDVEDDNWWDCTFDDAVRMGALMGIEISSTTHTSRKLDPKNSRSWEKVNIFFSGFWSQGDGASFIGRYRCVPDAVAKIKAECRDAELVAIAEELTAIQMRIKLEHGSTLQCVICRSTYGGNYSHSHTMNVSDVEWGTEDAAGPFGDADIDTSKDTDEMETLFRRFADWIYDQLEAEYEYLTSDEHVNERLSQEDYRFDEDGEII